jgi:hypothetical protein
MVKLFDDGFRLDVAWTAVPVPCRSFDEPGGAGSPFELPYALRQLGKLADRAGLTLVEGEVTARGTLAFDSRDLAGTQCAFVPDVRCKVALFSPLR